MKINGEWLSTKQVAERTNLTTARIYQLVNAGKLAPRGRVGPTMIFDSNDIEQFALLERPRGRPPGQREISKAALTISDLPRAKERNKK